MVKKSGTLISCADSKFIKKVGGLCGVLKESEKLDFDLGVAFGPGYPLIRLQALATRPVSAAIPNATSDSVFCHFFH